MTRERTRDATPRFTLAPLERENRERELTVKFVLRVFCVQLRRRRRLFDAKVSLEKAKSLVRTFARAKEEHQHQRSV